MRKIETVVVLYMFSAESPRKLPASNSLLEIILIAMIFYSSETGKFLKLWVRNGRQ